MAKIEISDELYEKIEKVAEQSEFETVEEYVEFVLGELTEEDEGGMSEDDEEQVKEKLKDLGYF